MQAVVLRRRGLQRTGLLFELRQLIDGTISTAQAGGWFVGADGHGNTMQRALLSYGPRINRLLERCACREVL